MMTDTVVDAGVVSPPLEPFGILRAVRAVLGGVRLWVGLGAVGALLACACGCPACVRL